MSRIFISYAREDSRFRKEFEKHLKSFQLHTDGNALSFFSDAMLEQGDWREQLVGELESCDVAVFLVSPGFMASNFIAKEELPRLLETGKQVHWVLLKPCNWQLVFGDQTAARDPKFPLANLSPSNRDQFWVDLTAKMIEALAAKAAEVLKFDRISDVFWVWKTPDFQMIALNLEAIRDWWSERARHFNESRDPSPWVSYQDAQELIELLDGYHLTEDVNVINQVPDQTESFFHVKWNVPEPSEQQLKLHDDASPISETHHLRYEGWEKFEITTGRMYPRFRDAHLALLHQRSLQSEANHQPNEDDRYHIKRILRGLHPKQSEFLLSLQNLKVSNDAVEQAELRAFRDHLKFLPLFYLALLWAVERRVFQTDAPLRNTWLSQSILLVDRICHWLLQAHSICKKTLRTNPEARRPQLAK